MMEAPTITTTLMRPCTCVAGGRGKLHRYDEKHCRHDVEHEDDEPICGTCNGSGEGMYDGARCSACGGSGVATTREKREAERDEWEQRYWRSQRDD